MNSKGLSDIKIALNEADLR